MASTIATTRHLIGVENEASASTAPDVVFLGYSLLLTSLVCLGTWPALLRLASFGSSSRTKPSTQGSLTSEQTPSSTCVVPGSRDARFAYLDYALAYAVSSLLPIGVMILSTSSSNEHNNHDKNDNNNNSVLLQYLPLFVIASAGGILLSLGNLSLQCATSVLGAPLTTVVALQASLTVTIGTSLNYVLQPEKTPHAGNLLVGVVLFCCAILAATRAHILYNGQQQPQQPQQPQQHCPPDAARDEVWTLSSADDSGPRGGKYPAMATIPSQDHLEHFVMLTKAGSIELESQRLRDDEKSIVRYNSLEDKTGGGSDRIEYWLKSSSSSQNMTALWVTMVGGCCFGFFSPAFNIAVNDPFDWVMVPDSSETGGLSVPVANLWFSLAFTVASIMGSLRFMYAPPEASGLEPTSWKNYIHSSSSSSGQRWGLAAGLLCGMANLLQFQGGRLIGFATADLVQAYPLVSTLWDVVVFGEHRRPGGRTVTVYLLLMYGLYLSGIACMMKSARL